MKNKLLIVFIILLSCMFVGCASNNKAENTSKEIVNNEVENIEESKKEEKEQEQIPKFKAQKMVITMTGDTSVASFYGQRIYFEDVFRQNGAGYFLKGLEKYFKNADINITNLENVFTDLNTMQQGKIYTYKSYSKDYIDILTANNIMYVNVVNNHMQDYLQAGFDESMQLLDEKGIKYFGTNLVDSNDPELGNIKVHRVQTFVKDDIKLGMAGYYAFNSSHPSDETIKEDIDNLKSQGCNFIIVAMHGGGQEDNIVLERQEIMARKFIDLGADMVYGHHPHAIQRIEDYNGKKIYYSLGNFLFVNYRSSKNPEGLLVELTLDMDENGKITPIYKNVPIWWMGGYTQKYTPIEMTEQESIDKVNRILNGSL